MLVTTDRTKLDITGSRWLTMRRLGSVERGRDSEGLSLLRCNGISLHIMMKLGLGEPRLSDFGYQVELRHCRFNSCK